MDLPGATWSRLGRQPFGGKQDEPALEPEHLAAPDERADGVDDLAPHGVPVPGAGGAALTSNRVDDAHEQDRLRSMLAQEPEDGVVPAGLVPKGRSKPGP